MAALSEGPVWPAGWRQHAGWIAGFLAVVAVFAVGGAIWFKVHP